MDPFAAKVHKLMRKDRSGQNSSVADEEIQEEAEAIVVGQRATSFIDIQKASALIDPASTKAVSAS